MTEVSTSTSFQGVSSPSSGWLIIQVFHTIFKPFVLVLLCLTVIQFTIIYMDTTHLCPFSETLFHFTNIRLSFQSQRYNYTSPFKYKLCKQRRNGGQSPQTKDTLEQKET